MQVGRSLGWSVRRLAAQRKKVIEVPIPRRLELTRLAQLVARVSTNKLVQIEAVAELGGGGLADDDLPGLGDFGDRLFGTE